MGRFFDRHAYSTYFKEGELFCLVQSLILPIWWHLPLCFDTTNFILLLGLQVKMTTGATIHTAAGLHMSVVKRMKPPIIPELDSISSNMSSNGSSKAPQTGSDSVPPPQISVR